MKSEEWIDKENCENGYSTSHYLGKVMIGSSDYSMREMMELQGLQRKDLVVCFSLWEDSYEWVETEKGGVGLAGRLGSPFGMESSLVE